MKSKRSGGRVFRIEEVEIVRRSPPTPLESTPIERALTGLRQLRRHVTFNWNRTEQHVGVYLARLRHGFENGFGKHLIQLAPPPTTRHVFAALSRRWRAPASAVALPEFRAEIKRRVSHVPIYVVAKRNGKLIFIKPEDNLKQNPVGLLFLSATGARQLLTKVQQDVPEYANEMEIVNLDLGSLYEMFSDREQNHLENAMFRFVPETKQVKNALEVMKQNGQRASAFPGVPVFHVDGLITGSDRVRPCFLCKEDLDIAINLATQRKLDRDRHALRDEVEILKGEAHEARLLARQTEGTDAEKWMSLAAKAETKSRRTMKQLQELPDSLSSLVQIDVRSLEDVLSEMETDTTGQYGSTMLIPSGLATANLLEAPLADTGDRRIINLESRT